MKTIEFINVSKKISLSNKNDVFTVLDNVSFKIENNGIWNIVGPSGSGKSTLLRLINRLEDPTSGTILIDGADICTIPVRKLRQKAAMVFQESSLLGLSVIENLKIPFELMGIKNKQKNESKIIDCLKRVDLDESFLNRNAHEMSGGQKQRIAIARALLFEPDILLLDEPTSALDKSLSKSFINTINQLHKKTEMLVVHVTHNLELVKKIGGTIVFIAGGRLIEIKSSGDFFKHPDKKITKKFISGTLLKENIDEFIRNDDH